MKDFDVVMFTAERGDTMKQFRYEIPLSAEETTQRLRAQMQGKYRLEPFLLLNMVPFTTKRGIYGRIQQQKIWAVAVSGYSMFPRRFFKGTLRERDGYTVLEGKFTHTWALRFYLLLALAWVEIPNYLAGASHGVLVSGFIMWLWFSAVALIPGILKNKKNEQLVRTYFENLCVRETDFHNL